MFLILIIAQITYISAGVNYLFKPVITCRFLLQAVRPVPCTLSICDIIFMLSLLPQLLDKKSPHIFPMLIKLLRLLFSLFVYFES